MAQYLIDKGAQVSIDAIDAGIKLNHTGIFSKLLNNYPPDLRKTSMFTDAIKYNSYAVLPILISANLAISLSIDLGYYIRNYNASAATLKVLREANTLHSMFQIMLDSLNHYTSPNVDTSESDYRFEISTPNLIAKLFQQREIIFEAMTINNESNKKKLAEELAKLLIKKKPSTIEETAEQVLIYCRSKTPAYILGVVCALNFPASQEINHDSLMLTIFADQFNKPNHAKDLILEGFKYVRSKLKLNKLRDASLTDVKTDHNNKMCEKTSTSAPM